MCLCTTFLRLRSQALHIVLQRQVLTCGDHGGWQYDTKEHVNGVGWNSTSHQPSRYGDYVSSRATANLSVCSHNRRRFTEKGTRVIFCWLTIAGSVWYCSEG